MNYEDKMKMLAWCKPEKKDELLMRIAKGETVNITQDEDLFFALNRDRISIEKQVERNKYKALADHMKNTRSVLHTVDGKTLGGKFKYKGEIPAEIFFTHPWFSPNLSKEERQANIEKFFRMFPDFSVKGR